MKDIEEEDNYKVVPRRIHLTQEDSTKIIKQVTEKLLVSNNSQVRFQNESQYT